MKRISSLTLVGIVLLAGCAAPLQAAASDSETTGSTISVSATGSASATPDLAVVRVSAEATADTANAARRQVARDVERVRAALSDAGVTEANVTTTAVGIAPVYDYTRGERSVVGYRAIHSLAVEIERARAGEIVDLAVGAGATTVDGVRFTLSDDRRTDLRATALDRAMDAARADANAIADAANLSVAGVQQASTGAEFVPYPARFESVADGETSIQPAPVTVTVTVDVTYSAR